MKVTIYEIDLITNALNSFRTAEALLQKITTATDQQMIEHSFFSLTECIFEFKLSIKELQLIIAALRQYEVNEDQSVVEPINKVELISRLHKELSQLNK